MKPKSLARMSRSCLLSVMFLRLNLRVQEAGVRFGEKSDSTDRRSTTNWEESHWASGRNKNCSTRQSQRGAGRKSPSQTLN